MRKFSLISVVLFVAAGIFTAAPATAAPIANGVSCAKSGAATTVSGRKYKCTKHPLSRSVKLKWLSNDCIVAANNYLKAKNTSAAISANYSAQIPVIDLGIASENTNMAAIQVKLATATAREAAAKVKLAAVLLLPVPADPVAALQLVKVKKAFSDAVGSWTSAIRAYTSKINSTTSTIRKLEASKLIAMNKPAELAAGIGSTKSTALLICTKGL